MDESVREKRLRRLGGGGDPATASMSTESASDAASAPPNATSSPMEGVEVVPGSTGPQTSAKALPPATPLASAVPASSTSAATSPAPKPLPENWQQRAILDVLNLSALDASVASVRAQIADERGLDADSAAAVNVDGESLERLVVAVLSTLPATASSRLEWLLSAYRRVTGPQSSAFRRRVEVIDFLRTTIRPLIVAYANLTLCVPALVGGPANSASFFVGALIDSTFELPHGFLAELLASTADSPALLDHVVTPLAQRLHATFQQGSLGLPDYLPALRLLCNLSTSVSAVQHIQSLPLWLPPSDEAPTGRELQLRSLLGAALTPSIVATDDPFAAQRFFAGNMSHRSAQSVEDTKRSVRNALQHVQDSLTDTIRSMVKKKPAREAVLAFLAETIDRNRKRSQEYATFLVHATDGFFLNLQSVLFALCEPIYDPLAPKFDRIDAHYLIHPRSRLRSTTDDATKLAIVDATEAPHWVDVRNQPRIQNFQNAMREQQLTVEGTSEHTGASADSCTGEGGATVESAPEVNFITEIFFLTSAMGHIGLIRSISRFEKINERLQKTHREVERRRQSPSAHPSAAEELTQLEATLQGLTRQHVAFDTALLSDSLMDAALRYYSATAHWLVSIADPLNKGLPLSRSVPASFASFPESILEDAVSFFLFIARWRPQQFQSCPMTDITRLIILFMNSEGYVKNPYLRAKLVEILYHLTPDAQQHRSRSLSGSHSLLSFCEYDPLALSYMIPGLMRLYVDVENTGSHTQFFDKFSIRYHSAIVLRNLWQYPGHRDAMVHTSASNRDLFCKFVNMLMNDTTFQLDESIECLMKINTLQKLMGNPMEWNSLSAEQKDEHTTDLNTQESRARSWLQFLPESMHLFTVLTQTIQSAFLVPELIERLAAMLSQNLLTLAGPKSQQNIKVTNPEKYGFKPRDLLCALIDVFVNLCEADDYALSKAVAKVGPHYDHSVFLHAVSLLTRFNMRPTPITQKMYSFIERVELTKLADQEEDEYLGDDIPEEFQDPLMSTIMQDPVLLPTSNNILDRSTIVQCLMNDPIDPFNRKALSVKDLIPQTELKEKITQWLKEKREEMRKK